MANIHVTTSLPPEIYNKAVEKNLKWNECMILGIKTMLNIELAPAYGETFEKPDEKVKKVQETMQKTIDQLHDDIKNKSQKQKSQKHY